jgi:hypothetical protein
MKPSELMETALADLIKCEKDSSYRISMWTWHTPKGSTCDVCFAGAYLAQTVGLGQDQTIIDVPQELRHTMVALDHFRQGQLKEGLFAIGEYVPDGLDDIPITDYHNSKIAFKKGIRQAIERLKEHNL